MSGSIIAQSYINKYHLMIFEILNNFLASERKRTAIVGNWARKMVE
ncbi:hypothetical protein BN938_1950 [Mucinivorans hirudinis]|uniref:Uncharacterized protein n=1 Tax=Mucinivorans hirudinis TaxID=1433126 RepID=A0A060R918_9BACT|nr:hypothetical protein BN938_1950 [Mucinivorans hirudinis]